jgi:hypothetical protein
MAPTGHEHPAHTDLNGVAFAATVHCLTGCAIGEVAGMVLGTALGWNNATTVVVSIVLAFVAGFTLTALPFLRRGYGFAAAARIALAADTASIALMELVDNALMLLIPGAMSAPLDSLLFWGSLALSLVVAGVVAFPLNRWMIARGKGHAVVHAHH